jgi:hypothetical protein
MRAPARVAVCAGFPVSRKVASPRDATSQRWLVVRFSGPTWRRSSPSAPRLTILPAATAQPRGRHHAVFAFPTEQPDTNTPVEVI